MCIRDRAGSGQNPGNNTDTDRSGAGQGGNAGATGGTGTGGSNGIIIINYGAGGTTTSTTLNWIHLSTTDGSLESPNPGNGACSGWCTDSAYNCLLYTSAHQIMQTIRHQTNTGTFLVKPLQAHQKAQVRLFIPSATSLM